MSFGLNPLAGLSGLFGDTISPQIETPLAPARPNLSPGGIQLGPGISGTVVGQVPASSLGGLNPQSNPGDTSIFGPGPSTIPGLVGQDLQALGAMTGQSASPLTPSAGATGSDLWVRFATGIVGIIFIGAGLFMFKGTQQIIVQAGRTAAKVAA